jgi:hypothetical protein
MSFNSLYCFAVLSLVPTREQATRLEAIEAGVLMLNYSPHPPITGI